MTDFELTDEAGDRCGTLTQQAVSDVECALLHRWAHDDARLPSPASWSDALRAGVRASRSAGARLVEARVTAREQGASETAHGARAERLRALLAALGFRHDDDRVEFRLALDAPGLGAWLAAREERSPLSWESLAPAGALTFERAAALLGRVSRGDPTSTPDEDPAAFLRACLDDDSFARDPSCVQVGTLASTSTTGATDAAFVMTQVRPATGWARVTYLGVTPEHRGRGLGTLVHARGIAVARARGARLYHGGTSTQNAPMRALFRALGADEFRYMERWVLAL